MAKIFNGNFYKGYSDPIEALDPYKKLVYASSGLTICCKCLELYGKGVKVISVSPADGKRKSSWHYQKCQCDSRFELKNNITTRNWPEHDFNLAVEFCFCCGSRLINSGHYSDTLFCEECLSLLKNHNNNENNFQIPDCRYRSDHPSFSCYNPNCKRRKL